MARTDRLAADEDAGDWRGHVRGGRNGASARRAGQLRRGRTGRSRVVRSDDGSAARRYAVRAPTASAHVVSTALTQQAVDTGTAAGLNAWSREALRSAA